MVWSANDGVSIILPSDHVDGDGRNWIMIGEDVPSQIASDFTAAFVFHSGNPDKPMFGFDWFAIGISTSGNLEFIGYFYRWSADPSAGGQEQLYRQSFMALKTPSGVDRAPTLEVGGGLYNEIGLNLTLAAPAAGTADSTLEGYMSYNAAGLADWAGRRAGYYHDANGDVRWSGGMTNAAVISSALGVIGSMPVAPKQNRWFIVPIYDAPVVALVGIRTDGTVYLDALSGSVPAGSFWDMGAINFNPAINN